MSLLNAPLRAGRIALKNRIVMPPLATETSDGGAVSEALLRHYAEKTRDGAIGLVIAEHCYVRMDGKASPRQLSAAPDCDPDGLKRLAETIHEGGAKAFAQINHAGAVAKASVTGEAPIAPCAVPSPRLPENLPRAMTRADIAAVVEAFAAAAARIARAGFDGVEIRSAHGYLLNQFYSPLTNRREDEYGGTLENRLRIHREVIAAVRAAVGGAFPIALRLGACDYMDGGATVEDAAAAAAVLERAGIDLLDISGGFCGYVNPRCKEQGYFSELSAAAKRQASLPVLLTGGIVDAAAAERLLREGAADLIGVGRALLKDSRWPRNALRALDQA